MVEPVYPCESYVEAVTAAGCGDCWHKANKYKAPVHIDTSFITTFHLDVMACGNISQRFLPSEADAWTMA